MTSDAKQALKETVRSLRGRLLADLHNATESAWQMGARVQNTVVERRGGHRRLWIHSLLDRTRRSRAHSTHDTTDVLNVETRLMAGRDWPAFSTAS